MISIALLRGVRDQRQLTGTHDGGAQLALVHGTGARDATRQDLGALGNERHQQLRILVVDVVDLLSADLAPLAAAKHRAALPVLALRSGGAVRRLAAATATAAAEASLAAVHRSTSAMSKRSSRSSSRSRWPSPGARSAGRPRAVRRRRDVSVRLLRVRSMTVCSSSMRTTRCRMIRSVTLKRRSISFITSPPPLITSRT